MTSHRQGRNIVSDVNVSIGYMTCYKWVKLSKQVMSPISIGVYDLMLQYSYKNVNALFQGYL